MAGESYTTKKILLKAVDGTTTQYFIPYVNNATADKTGLVKPDGTTITVDENGVISAQVDTSGLVPNTRTVNSKALSSDITLNGADIALTGYTKASAAADVAATDTVNQAIGKLQKTLDGKQASGSYAAASHTHTKSEITDFPSIPTVNNNTITIKKNGTKVDDFTLNQSSDKAIDISVPTQASDINAANATHTHVGTETVLTGYSKASSASAVAATDTVNAAIGKIEKALDGKQASGDYAASTHSHVGSEVTLTGYTKASSAADVAATDTVNQAIGKLQKTLDGKQAAGSYAAADHTHTAADVGAAEASHTHTVSDVTDFPTIPTITDTYSGTSSDGMSGKAVKSAIDSAVASVYKPAGSVAFASRPTPGASYKGNVYNITDEFTTDSTFVEGAGNKYPAGTNIVCINTTGSTYKWDVLAGFVDLSSYQKSDTAVTHTASTKVGDTDKPVYIAADGSATAISYTIKKSVPADAIFTDTVYTHPTTAGNKHIPSGGSSGQILKYDSDGTATWANEYSYTHPTTAGNKHVPTGGSSGQVLTYGGSSGTATWGSVPSHTHVGTETVLTGYEKASSASAVAATDTVNAAIGKIEKALDGKQASGSYAAASHTHGKADITDFPSIPSQASDIGAAEATHTHTVSDVTDFPSIPSQPSDIGAAASSHTHVGSEVALTGYEKASTASAIATTDSVNEALGKVEKALDGKQAAGSYANASHTHTKSEITDFPTIPTVNNKTITIQKNGTKVDDFTLNQSSNKTINITVPTQPSDVGAAAASHTHVGTETVLTGYEKASSASAVAATDTVNAAIGKIEKALDGKQASGSYASASHTHTYSDVGAAAASHSHAGSEVTLTGYEKAASASAIATTDTVNAALGKLEKALDGKQGSGSYAPTTHTHTSGDVTALTGYTKASTAAEIAATDSLNTALGKIQKSLDGKQASGSYAAADHTHSGYVPTSRTVNSKALTSDITLSAADVGAAASDHTHSGYAASSHTHVGTETVLTGYEKAASASAVATTDTVNQAIGKLEKAIDGKQASGSYANATHTHGKADITDFPAIPTVTDTYSGTSSDAMSGKAVKSAIDTAVASVYKPAGSVAFASRPTPGASYKGNVYNITDSFTTDSTFVEGSGNTYPAGTNIVCINTTGSTYKWDVLAGFVDLSGYATTSHTHTYSDVGAAAASHSHVGTETVLTGYAKAASASAVAATDTVNAAIGKLEKALDGKQASGSYAASDHTHSGYVPTSRTVNSKALTSDITLTASDVGAAASDHTHSGYAASSHSHVGSEVTLTGYTKASAAADVAATDTVNQAIGKLQKTLDGKQAAGSYAAADHSHSGYVPTSRTVNSKALTSDITLSASDVGAAASNHSHDTFVKSGSGAAAGMVPAPSTTAGTSKYLCEDGTWAEPAGTYTHPTTSGNKHIPSGGSSGKILKWASDGTASWETEYSYTHPTTAGNKHIPSGGSTGQILTYGGSSGTASWANPTTYSDFVGSGSTAAAGLVPKPSTTAGTSKYLCEDGTWATPPDTVYTHPTTSGNKHIPSGGSSGQILKYSSDGTAEWANEYSYSHPTTSGNKHIPSGGSSGKILKWSADGTATWETEYSYTHPTTAGNKHIPSGGSSGQALVWSSDGTATWGTVSAGAHTHAASDVTAMTSYSKASAAAAIATTDSLNTAVGKLEYKVDDVDTQLQALVTILNNAINPSS